MAETMPGGVGFMTGLNYTRQRPGVKQQTLKQGIMQDVNNLAQTLYKPAAYMTPGIGDYMAHQDAVEKYGQAKESFNQGDYMNAALFAGGGLGDDLTTVPVVGDIAMAAKGLGSVAGGLMTAYHGTPHRFPPTDKNPLGEFDLSKIGTGEGAQAYGHGIYLAESSDVAKSYSLLHRNSAFDGGKKYEISDQGGEFWVQETNNALSPANNGYETWSNFIHTVDGDTGFKSADEAIAYLKKTKRIPDNAKIDDIGEGIFETYSQAPNFYEVDLPDEHIAKMLDWDVPLSEQPESVRRVLAESKQKSFSEFVSYQDSLAEKYGTKNFMRELEPSESENMLRLRSRVKKHEYDQDMSGGDIYTKLSANLSEDGRGYSQEAASKMLNTLGIPGIKYYDQGSRAAGEGTRNFVVFDTDIAKILSRE